MQNQPEIKLPAKSGINLNSNNITNGPREDSTPKLGAVSLDVTLNDKIQQNQNHYEIQPGCSKMSSPAWCRSQPESNSNTISTSNTDLISNIPRGSIFKYNDPNTVIRANDLYGDDGSSVKSCSMIHWTKNVCWYAKNHASHLISMSFLMAYLAYFCLTLGLNHPKVSRDTDFIVLTSLILLYQLTTSRTLRIYIWSPLYRFARSACFCWVKNSSHRSRNNLSPSKSLPDYTFDQEENNFTSRTPKFNNICKLLFSHLYLVVVLLVFGHLGYEVYQNPKTKLPPAGGIVALLCLLLLFTKNFRKIPWRTVLTGLALQILAADFIMNVRGGHYPFLYIGDKMNSLMKAIAVGCKFAFGDNYRDHSFVFEALPLVIFLSSLISVFTYLGILDWIVNLGSLLFRWTMKTKKVESSCAMSNIFLGQVEALLLIKEYLPRLTKSELLACMLAGMGSISGTNYAIYLTFNISPVHLFAANIMAAPGALVVAKLLLPETEEIKKLKSGDKLDELDENESKISSAPKERNVLEAFTNGATTALPIVGCMLGIMIAFMSMQALLDNFFQWFFSQAGLENFTFRILLSYIFLPFAWLIGIPFQECQTVATLLGTKFVLNEFLAYVDMKESVDAGKLTARSIIITTYALCGCANIGSIGCQLGTMNQLAPSKRSEVGKLVFISLFGAFIMNLISACIAAIVYNEENAIDFSIIPTIVTAMNQTTIT